MTHVDDDKDGRIDGAPRAAAGAAAGASSSVGVEVGVEVQPSTYACRRLPMRNLPTQLLMKTFGDGEKDETPRRRRRRDRRRSRHRGVIVG